MKQMNKKKIVGDFVKLNKKNISTRNLPSSIYYLDTGSITRNKIDSLEYLSLKKDTYPSRARRTVRDGTIIYSTVRPIQEHYGYMDNPDKNLIVSTGFVTIDVISDDVNSKYLYYYLSLPSVTEYLQKIAETNASSYPSIRPEHLENLPLFLPSNVEKQKKIASILSTLDKKIEVNNQINVELEAMAKTLYDYWFLQFDFPDENGKPYHASGGEMVYSKELGREIPKGWIAGRLADIFIVNPTLDLATNQLSSYIDMNALPERGYMTLPPEKKKYNGGMKFQNGDVAVARITPCLENGKTGLISLLNHDEVGFGSTEFIILRGKKKKLSSFGALLARSTYFREYAIKNMTGTSGRKRVNADIIENLPLALPPEKILSDFENLIKSFFEIQTANVKENQELEKLRDWLLPMLMNGQVTVMDEPL